MRWQAILYLVAIAAFTLFWLNYWTIALALTAPGSSAAGLLRVPLLERIVSLLDNARQMSSAAHGADNLLRLLTWQNPLLWVGVAAAVIGLLKLPRISWCLLAGVVLTIGTMLLLMPAQGHGWGYRYLHGLIGSLALIGTAGWVQMERLHGQAFRQPVMMCFAMTLAAVIPARAILIERTIAPWLRATEVAMAMPADVVIVDSMTISYGYEIPRSGPYAAERPVVMMMEALSADQIRRLCGKYRVAYYGAAEARETGIPTRTFEEALVMAPEMEKAMGQTAEEYEEKYRVLTSGTCTRLPAQQGINGTSGSSTIEQEAP
jgi:hypothetical protein